MKTKMLITSITAGIICGFLLVLFGISPHESADANSDEVPRPQPILEMVSDEFTLEMIELMVASHTNWSSLDMQAETTTYNLGEEIRRTSSHILVEGVDSIKIEWTEYIPQQKTGTWLYYDGSISEADASGRVTSSSSFSIPQERWDIVPTSLGDVIGMRSVSHPLRAVMPVPSAEYLYPVGLAQRGGHFELLGTEEIAGRATLYVEWTHSTPNTLRQLLWIDEETGIVLKSKGYVGNELNILYEEFETTSIQVNPSLTPADFDVSQPA